MGLEGIAKQYSGRIDVASKGTQGLEVPNPVSLDVYSERRRNILIQSLIAEQEAIKSAVPSRYQPEYPVRNDFLNLQYGEVELSITYTVSKEQGTISRAFRGRKPRTATIEATLSHNFNIQKVPKLVFEIIQQGKNPAGNESQDVINMRVLEYVQGLVDQARAKVASLNPANDTEAMENDIVHSIARMLQDQYLAKEYQVAFLKKAANGYIAERITRAKKYQEDFAKEMAGLEVQAKELDAKLKQMAATVVPTVEVYAEERKAAIAEIANKAAEAIKAEEDDIRKGLEAKVTANVERKKAAIELELSELTAKKAEILNILEGNKKSFKEMVPKIEAEMRKYFPDYDQKQSDEHDITPEVRLRAASQLYEACMARGVLKYDAYEKSERRRNSPTATPAEFAFRYTQLSFGIIQALAKKVKKTAGGQRFTREDMEGIISEAGWLITTLDGDVEIVTGYIDALEFRKKQGIAEIHKCIEHMLQKPKTEKAGTTTS